MKKMLFTVMIILISGICFGQDGYSYYVSSRGNDNSDGLSEATSFLTLRKAFRSAQEGTVKKITVIGTLNGNNDPGSILFRQNYGCSFGLFDFGSKNVMEIIISGKPMATESEKARISGAGYGAGVLVCSNVKIRFENIEISGGEDDGSEEAGDGIDILDGAIITLGEGSVIKSNQAMGIYIGNGSCILDGGTIQDNLNHGIMVGKKGVFTMKNGTIRNNKSDGNGGGVIVLEGGIFSMIGGIISNNSTEMAGGGLFVFGGGRFDMSSGSITNNTAKMYPNYANVFKNQGALGLSRSF